jgi:DNA-binding XRE family transcriptional regulator
LSIIFKKFYKSSLDFLQENIILTIVNCDEDLRKQHEGEIMTNFRKYRLMNNLRQEDVAKAVGVSQSAVAVLDKHGCFNTITARKYAKALGCNPLLLLDGLEG